MRHVITADAVMQHVVSESNRPEQHVLSFVSYVRRHVCLAGTAAIRVDNWKLILGRPDCVPHNDTINGTLTKCPDGWVHPNGTEVRELLISLFMVQLFVHGFFTVITDITNIKHQ